MSWSKTLNGSPAAVNAAVEADTYIPAGVKALIREMVNAVGTTANPSEGTAIVTLNGIGHFDSNGGSAQVSIGRLVLAPEPTPSPPSETSPA